MNIKRKYRKKPVIIEAYQTDEELLIHTLEGDLLASVGDYIITGINGEQYPCKPDIFEKLMKLCSWFEYGIQTILGVERFPILSGTQNT